MPSPIDDTVVSIYLFVDMFLRSARLVIEKIGSTSFEGECYSASYTGISIPGTWYLEFSGVDTRWSLQPCFITRYGCSLVVLVLLFLDLPGSRKAVPGNNSSTDYPGVLHLLQ